MKVLLKAFVISFEIVLAYMGPGIYFQKVMDSFKSQFIEKLLSCCFEFVVLSAYMQTCHTRMIQIEMHIL